VALLPILSRGYDEGEALLFADVEMMLYSATLGDVSKGVEEGDNVVDSGE
jgi:hypothetical protein